MDESGTVKSAEGAEGAKGREDQGMTEGGENIPVKQSKPMYPERHDEHP